MIRELFNSIGGIGGRVRESVVAEDLVTGVPARMVMVWMMCKKNAFFVCGGRGGACIDWLEETPGEIGNPFCEDAAGPVSKRFEKREGKTLVRERIRQKMGQGSDH